MTDCERLSDRMPDVALGRSSWSDDERQHLESCPDCLAEWKLIEMTSRLGASLPSVAASDTVSRALLDRLAAARARTHVIRRRLLAAGLAAAAVAIIAVRVPQQVPVDTTAAGQTVPIPELDDLPASELESILGALDDSTDTSRSFDGPDDDFDNHDLEQALGAWEG